MASATYDSYGKTYASTRQPDPRIAACIDNAIGDARTVVNVGAGTGAYESSARRFVAVEPSAEMLRQRATDAAPAVQAIAEALPLADDSFDCAFASLTIHHWTDWRAGIAEMRRVAERIVIYTFEPDATFWLTDEYLPEISVLDRERIPAIESVLDAIGGGEVTNVPVPHDCIDGYLGAFWRRPDAYLHANVRAGMSPFHMLDLDVGITKLANDLESGRWDELFGSMRELDELDIGYRIVTSYSRR